jgi:hypothetical protein
MSAIDPSWKDMPPQQQTEMMRSDHGKRAQLKATTEMIKLGIESRILSHRIAGGTYETAASLVELKLASKRLALNDQLSQFNSYLG